MNEDVARRSIDWLHSTSARRVPIRLFNLSHRISSDANRDGAISHLGSGGSQVCDEPFLSTFLLSQYSQGATAKICFGQPESQLDLRDASLP